MECADMFAQEVVAEKYEHLMSDEWHSFQEGEPPKMDDFLKIVF